VAPQVLIAVAQDAEAQAERHEEIASMRWGKTMQWESCNNKGNDGSRAGGHAFFFLTSGNLLGSVQKKCLVEKRHQEKREKNNPGEQSGGQLGARGEKQAQRKTKVTELPAQWLAAAD
jgi:hypothetical protein